MIRVHYSTVDGFGVSKSFPTLPGARGFAHHWVGSHPEIGSHYAVSGDGVGKVTVEGATLADLFPSSAPAEYPTEADVDAAYRAEEAADWDDYVASYPAPVEVSRAPECTCSLEQLYLVGCDCGNGVPF